MTKVYRLLTNSLTGWRGRVLVLVLDSFWEPVSEKKRGVQHCGSVFGLNMDDRNIEFVRDLVVTQGKTHSQVSWFVQEAYPGNKGFSSWPVRRFCLKNGILAESQTCQIKRWITVRMKLLLGCVFLLEVFLLVCTFFLLHISLHCLFTLL